MKTWLNLIVGVALLALVGAGCGDKASQSADGGGGGGGAGRGGGAGTAGAQAGGAGGQTLPDAGPEAPSPSDGGGATGGDARDAADAPSGGDARDAADAPSGADARADLASPPDVGRAEPGLHVLAGALGGAGRADDVGADARFNGLGGLAWDGAGNLYVGDNSAIRKIALATGAVTTLAGALGTSGFADGVGATARFAGASALVWDGAGNLYVADTSNDIIRKVVVATGAVSTVAGSPKQFMVVDGVGAQARFWYPVGLALDGAGNLFVSDSGGGTIRRLVLATGEVTTIAGTAGTVGSVDGTGSAARFSSPDQLARRRRQPLRRRQAQRHHPQGGAPVRGGHHDRGRGRDARQRRRCGNERAAGGARRSGLRRRRKPVLLRSGQHRVRRITLATGAVTRWRARGA